MPPPYPLYTALMRIILNGEPHEVAQGATLSELVRQLGLEHAACAAEVNRRLVPKKLHAERALREGDAVELVTLVGGG